MLLTRVLTAVAVLVVLLGMLFFATPTAWSLFVLAVALLACWEWSRMSGLGHGAQLLFLFVSGTLGGAFWLLYWRDPEGLFVSFASRAFLAAAIFWIVVAPLWLARHLRPRAWLCAIAGWVVVWPTWFAFVVLHDASPWLLLATAALVWIADIAAYFAAAGGAGASSPRRSAPARRGKASTAPSPGSSSMARCWRPPRASDGLRWPSWWCWPRFPSWATSSSRG